VLVRLNELRPLMKSFAEIRCKAEQASLMAARSLAAKAGRELRLMEADIRQMVRDARAENLDRED
jgi:hypothetical protein